MKGKLDLATHEFKKLVSKGGGQDEDNGGGEIDEVHLVDKIEGLGHSKRHHITSGIYNGLVDSD